MAQTKSRVKRTPVGGKRDVLTVSNKDPNYEYRWVNDIPGRIQRFMDGGWEVVNHDTEVGGEAVDKGSRLGSAVTKSVGGITTAVLMRILKEWYDEDQVAKQEAVKALEATMQQKAEADYGSLRVTRQR